MTPISGSDPPKIFDSPESLAQLCKTDVKKLPPLSLKLSNGNQGRIRGRGLAALGGS